MLVYTVYRNIILVVMLDAAAATAGLILVKVLASRVSVYCRDTLVTNHLL
jgi:hypothetical protein